MRCAGVGSGNASVDGDGAPHCFVVGLQAFEKSHDVDELRRFAVAQAAHEFQRLRHHRFHFQQIRLEFLAQIPVLQQFGAQSHARQRRLEVVRHGREKARPLVDEAWTSGSAWC